MRSVAAEHDHNEELFVVPPCLSRADWSLMLSSGLFGSSETMWLLNFDQICWCFFLFFWYISNLWTDRLIYGNITNRSW
jgi:hypothetical protein